MRRRLSIALLVGLLAAAAGLPGTMPSDSSGSNGAGGVTFRQVILNPATIHANILNRLAISLPTIEEDVTFNRFVRHANFIAIESDGQGNETSQTYQPKVWTLSSTTNASVSGTILSDVTVLYASVLTPSGLSVIDPIEGQLGTITQYNVTRNGNLMKPEGAPASFDGIET